LLSQPALVDWCQRGGALPGCSKIRRVTQINEKANIPAGFGLYRRVHGGNEPNRDDDSVELHDGDHFFARPPSKVSMTEEDSA